MEAPAAATVSRPAPLASRTGPRLALVAIAAFALSLTRIAEHDAPWLVRAGELVLRTRSLPRHDPFSYTSDVAWMHHEWLSEVLLALTHRAGGFAALTVLQALCGAGVALLLARLVPGTGLADLAIAVAVVALRDLLAPRAELFALVLLAATYLLVARDLGRPGRALWLAVPLQLVWTQLHGGNPFGVALLALAALAGGREGRPRRVAVTLACALATCAGPYGVHVHDHFLRARADLALIAEWRPLWAFPLATCEVLGAAALATLAVVAIVLAGRGGRTPLLRFQALAAALFVALALWHARFLREAILVTAPLAGAALARVRVSRAAVVVPACAAVLLAGVQTSSARSGTGLDPLRFPVDAVAWLRRAAPPGPMFNSYNLGGYLLYAWPGQPVFVDGRAFTVYSAGFLERFAAVYRDPGGFDDLAARYGFRLAVLSRTPVTQRLVAHLAGEPAWHLAYVDAQAAVFER